MSEWTDTPVSGGRQRGLLDQFLARSALLASIYLVVNVLHQQAYLDYLGLRIGLWPIASALPLLSNFFVGLYSFIIWAIITRLPDTWFNHLAEITNLATWRNSETWSLRIGGLTVVFLLLISSNILFLSTVGGQPLSAWNIVWPTGEYFAWVGTAVIFSFIFALICAVSMISYIKIRDQGLHQLVPKKRRSMRFLINSSLPACLLLMLITVFLVIPSWYGAKRAQNDIRRLAEYEYQLVRRLELQHPSCDLHVIKISDHYVWTQVSSDPKIQYLGRLLNMHLFLKVSELKIGQEPHLQFSPCLINDSNLISLEISRGLLAIDTPVTVQGGQPP
jgi:Na+-transporting methylmalonyl-CoA/oxaloacetate decarboxylase gamma subunit/nitrate reductase NapE component